MSRASENDPTKMAMILSIKTEQDDMVREFQVEASVGLVTYTLMIAPTSACPCSNKVVPKLNARP